MSYEPKAASNAGAEPDFTTLRARMQDFVTCGQFAGISTLVERDGQVIAFDATGWRDPATCAPIERDTIFRLASMSKPITSVAALILVKDGRLSLSDPIARWLPEMRNLAVLRKPDAPLDDVVPVGRPPTLLDLMTHTAGFAWGKGLDVPLTRAMSEAAGQTPFVPYDPDTFVQRVGSLPLIRQPGSGWHYGISTDILGVIVSRASDQSLPDFLMSRVFHPIGMEDTGFHVPALELDRLSVGFARDSSGCLVMHDDPRTGFWSKLPLFPAGGGGLVSTVDDYSAFARMLLNKGLAGQERILSERLVTLMTSNLLNAEQRHALDPSIDFLQGQGFGLGVAVTIGQKDNRRPPGSFGWPGGYGTNWFADPVNDVIATLMTQVWLENQVQIGPAFEESVYAGLRSRTA